MNSRSPKGLEAFITQCPLGALLLLLMLVLTLAGFGRQVLVQGSAERALKASDTPYAVSAFKEPQVIQDPVYVIEYPSPPTKPERPYDPMEGRDHLIPPEGYTPGPNHDSSEVSSEESPGESSEESSEESSVVAEKEDQDDQMTHNESVSTPFRDEPRDPVTPRSNNYHDPARRALNTDAEYQTVDDAYFNNTLFIGDSRIDGIGLFSDLKNADYLCKTGISVYTVLGYTMKFRSGGALSSEEVYLRQALSRKQYDHIYIMIGVNELGINDEKAFVDQYRIVIEEIQKLQPDATIYILGIMNVSQEVSADSSYCNNDNINARNWEIAHIADGKSIFYLDVNPAVCDEDGFLRKDYSNDGIHLRSDCYDILIDYLKAHAIL